jgi:3-hydroxybutyryl-CoA dehydrogenase
MTTLANAGVVGAGVMGCDMTLTLAVFGYHVTLVDNDDKQLQAARTRIAESLQLYKMMRSEYRAVTSNEVLEKIRFTKDLSELRHAAVIVENIAEDMDAKKQLYGELDSIAGKDVLMGVNTSCIPIATIARQVSNPARVIGMHFMNPVPLKDVVEVIRSEFNDAEAIERTREFLKRIRKTAIVVNDSPGFVANRLSHLFMNEAACLVQEKVAAPAEIDLIFKKGYGHSMGPLETADLIGIDTVVRSLDVLHKNYNDPKFRSCNLLKSMVEEGLLGRKSGRGFYRYS